MLTDVELDQAISKARDSLLHVPLHIQPQDAPNNEATKTIDSLDVYISSRIRRFRVRLIEAWGSGCFEAALDQYGLRSDLVSQEVVQQCLCELLVDEELRRQVFYHVDPTGNFDPYAPSIEQQAIEHQLSIVKPNTQRGRYIGRMYGQDSHAALIKVSSNRAIELPLWTLSDSGARVGDELYLEFEQGALFITVSSRNRSI